MVGGEGATETVIINKIVIEGGGGGGRGATETVIINKIDT